MADSGNAADFDARSDDVFGRIAARYDLLCDLFSLGIHRHWKRRVAKAIAASEWTQLLDMATGTGDIVLRISRLLPPGGSQRIVAADISKGMLAIAEKRLQSVNTPRRTEDVGCLFDACPSGGQRGRVFDVVCFKDMRTRSGIARGLARSSPGRAIIRARVV